MGAIEAEMLQGGCFADDGHARIGIFDYIEACYNTRRKHSSLGYRNPVQFEACLNSPNWPKPVPEFGCISNNTVRDGFFFDWHILPPE